MSILQPREIVYGFFDMVIFWMVKSSLDQKGIYIDENNKVELKV